MKWWGNVTGKEGKAFTRCKTESGTGGQENHSSVQGGGEESVLTRSHRWRVSHRNHTTGEGETGTKKLYGRGCAPIGGSPGR